MTVKISNIQGAHCRQMGYVVVTNNPLVLLELSGDHTVDFAEQTYLELLERVRSMVHEGSRILSHPQAGGVQSGETPYRSILVQPVHGPVDVDSLKLIESAIAATRKFQNKTPLYKEGVSRDFQVVDLALIRSGIESADAM